MILNDQKSSCISICQTIPTYYMDRGNNVWYTERWMCYIFAIFIFENLFSVFSTQDSHI